MVDLAFKSCHILQYSRHLNTRLVWFSNGPNVSGCWTVRFSNGILVSVDPKHLKTGQKCLVFKWSTIILVSVDPNHSKTELKCPVFKWCGLFEYQTLKSPVFRLIRYSDGYCTDFGCNWNKVINFCVYYAANIHSRQLNQFTYK